MQIGIQKGVELLTEFAFLLKLRNMFPTYWQDLIHCLVVYGTLFFTALSDRLLATRLTRPKLLRYDHFIFNTLDLGDYHYLALEVSVMSVFKDVYK